MPELPPDHFPFDGSCVGSKYADLTLRFDDGSTLEANATLLKMASHVLATALDDCTHEMELCLEGEDKFSWILLLNALHPAAPMFYNKPMDLNCFNQMKGVLALTNKYLIKCVRDNVEESIVKEIANQQDFQGKQSRKVLNPTMGNPGIDLFSVVRLGAQFNLERVKSQGMQYFSHILCHSIVAGMGSEETGRTGHQVVDLIESLTQEGCDVWAKDLSREIIGGIRLNYNGYY